MFFKKDYYKMAKRLCNKRSLTMKDEFDLDTYISEINDKSKIFSLINEAMNEVNNQAIKVILRVLPFEMQMNAILRLQMRDMRQMCSAIIYRDSNKKNESIEEWFFKMHRDVFFMYPSLGNSVLIDNIAYNDLISLERFQNVVTKANFSCLMPEPEYVYVVQEVTEKIRKTQEKLKKETKCCCKS